VTPAGAEAACATIWGNREAGTKFESLPPALRPATRAEGYAIQAQLEAHSVAPLWGWKIAATSVAGQRHINVDGPLAGRILAEMVVPEGAPVPLSGNAMLVAEPEFVFRMGRDLQPRDAERSQEEVMAAVAALHLGIEAPDSRFAAFTAAGGPQLIADNACAHLFVLGAEAPALWRDLDLSQHRVACTVEGRYAREGIGANVLGDPRIALTWLANELSRHGVTLRAGQYVTTGTCAVPLDIRATGDAITADYGVLGRIAVRFEG
jgi:2-keto-4-pentenoate hydratase